MVTSAATKVPHTGNVAAQSTAKKKGREGKQKKSSPIAIQRRERLQTKSPAMLTGRSVDRRGRELQIAAANQNFPVRFKNRQTTKKKGVRKKIKGVAKKLRKKGKLAMYASGQTPLLLLPYGAIAALSLLSLAINYLLGDGVAKDVVSTVIPINSWIFMAQGVAAAIGIICVMLSYFGMALTLTNIFSSKVLLPFLIAIFFYVACLVLPILGLFPMLIVWLWIVAFIY